MNPFDLSASDLLIWGIVLHLIADWPLQNDWMAKNKTDPSSRAGSVHGAIHTFLLSFVFGWAAIPLGVAHYFIDLRWPVAKWSKLMRQTQPQEDYVEPSGNIDLAPYQKPILLYDIGTEVRIWNDQVFHIACIAAAALLVSL